MRMPRAIIMRYANILYLKIYTRMYLRTSITCDVVNTVITVVAWIPFLNALGIYIIYFHSTFDCIYLVREMCLF